MPEEFKVHKITVAVAALIEDSENRLLMVREAQPDCYGLWNQPAGHLDAGESIEQGVLREVQEETGYSNVRIDGISRIYYFVEHSVLRINFRASLLDHVQGPLADDVLETGWFSRQELSEMNRQGQLRSQRTALAIQDWLNGESSNFGIIQTVIETKLARILF